MAADSNKTPGERSKQVLTHKYHINNYSNIQMNIHLSISWDSVEVVRPGGGSSNLSATLHSPSN